MWGPGINFFWWHQNLDQKLLGFFPLPSALDWICQWGSGPTFFGHTKFQTKNFFGIFSFTEHSWLLIFHRGIWANFFWSLQIWGQRIYQNFFIYWALWTLNFSEGGVWASTIFGQAKFETKNFFGIFFISWVLWTEFVSGDLGQIFGHAKFETKKFLIYWALWTLNFSEDRSGPTFFGYSKLEVKHFSEFFHLLSTINSEFFRGGLGINYFLSCQIWGQKIFRIYSFTECSGLNLSEGCLGQLFLVMPKLRPKNFSFTEHSGLWIFQRTGLGQLFFITPNLRSKTFSEFFHLHSTLDSEFFREGSLGTKFFESCQIWGEKFFGISSFNKHCGLWIFQREIQANFFLSCQI